MGSPFLAQPYLISNQNIKTVGGESLLGPGNIDAVSNADLLSALVPYATIAYVGATFAPISHTHGNITNDGRIGSTANLPLITTTGGAVTVGSFGTAANTFCQGNDSRLSDARTPTSHVHGNITNAGAIGTTADLPVSTTASGVLDTRTAADFRTIIQLSPTNFVGFSRVTVSANGLAYSSDATPGTARWIQYAVSPTVLLIRDETNGRTHVSYIQGATSALANTIYSSQMTMQSTCIVDGATIAKGAVTSKDTNNQILPFSSDIAYGGNGHLALYSESSSVSGQIYLGSLSFRNGSFWNSAPGIGGVGSAPGSELGFFVYTGSPNSRTEAGRFDASLNLRLQRLCFLGSYTVATLPAASANSGAIATVTNATSATNGSTVSGGGSIVTLVQSNGTNWIVK